jgi:hypothetical protein
MAARLAVSACLLACSLVAASAASGAPGDAPVRPQPPTSAEVERATQRFLAREGDSAGAGGTVADAAAGTGGVGQGGGGGATFPGKRMVALYGAPQMTATILGRKSVGAAAKRARKQASKYKGEGRPVVAGLDLVATIATADSGDDGKYRDRQSDAVIERYFDAAKGIDGHLILDIQPGRSSFMSELKAHREWIARPDVDVALDPEWNVGKKGKPGKTTGKVTAKELNKVAAFVGNVADSENLPPKAVIVHQFRQGSVKKRDQIEQPDGVQMTLNFDGIGSRSAKAAGYRRLTRDGLFAGFSLFYRLDKGLMSPKQVAGLEPTPDFVLYQ